MRNLILVLIFLTSCAWAKNRPIYPVTPTVAAESTFKVNIYDNLKNFQGSGTAWVVDVKGENTYLITAGHVCSGVTYKLTGMEGDREKFEADATMQALDPDLCILKYKGWLARPLLLARWMPKYGQEVGYVGAPYGRFGEGVAPFFTGYYIGGSNMSTPVAPGASGSAVWTREGVFGVLVTGDLRFNNVAGFVQIDELKEFLKHAGL